MLKAPLFALRLRFSSELVDEVILASQRAMPVRTLETGYAFRHPLLREALAEVLDKRPRNEAAPRAVDQLGPASPPPPASFVASADEVAPPRSPGVPLRRRSRGARFKGRACAARRIGRSHRDRC